MMRCRQFFILVAVAAGTRTSLSNVPESAFDRDPWPAAKEGPVKVFVLAGQSNMQGHAALRTLEYLIYNEETAAEYQQWKDREGGWTQRNDVWVWTTDGPRSGSLRPGFGASEMKMGPEVGFGWVMGEYMDEQVLLIKTCWGGRRVNGERYCCACRSTVIQELEAVGHLQPLDEAAPEVSRHISLLCGKGWQ